MDIKNILSSIYELNKKINYLKGEEFYYRELSLSVQSVRYDQESTNPNKNIVAPFVRYLEKAERIKDKINELEKERSEKMIELEEFISLLTSHEDRMVLRYRYIVLMTWDEIANKMHYSKRHTLRRHEQAIEKLKMSLNVT